ncbi:MAG: TonB-dependent receptor plug domain-containing protein, partial [Flavobacteriales bacterium]
MRKVLRVLLASALGGALPTSAQLVVQVGDAELGAPVAYAHVQHAIVGQPYERVQVSGPDGRCVLPVDAAQAARGIALRISFIGYLPWQDTVHALADVRCMLRRDPLRLGEVVVTGQYAPGSAEAAVHKLRVIDAQRIRRMAAQHLGDALRDQLNLRLAQDNVLGASVSMQGLGGENVKVLIDGVPVTGRQNGNVDLSQLDLAGIERIELVEGPLSVSYGTNALAGTINLITKKSGAAPATVRASAYAEHIGRLNATIGGSRQWGRSELVLNGARNFFAGWDPRQDGFPAMGPQVADTNR